tara:strand:- start:18 stop:164 length:147 start_codon:yes stop_codon:yes gene_type:complete
MYVMVINKIGVKKYNNKESCDETEYLRDASENIMTPTTKIKIKFLVLI